MWAEVGTEFRGQSVRLEAGGKRDLGETGGIKLI